VAGQTEGDAELSVSPQLWRKTAFAQVSPPAVSLYLLQRETVLLRFYWLSAGY